MNTIEALGFSWKLVLGTLNATAIFSAILAFGFGFVVLGLFWGMAWNRKWSLLGHIGASSLSFILSLVLVVTALAWMGADKAENWLGTQRESVGRMLAGSGTLNREILRKAWPTLQSLGGQKDLTPPDEGGNEIRLNNDDEAKLLAKSAADSAKRPLLEQLPFVFGLPCMVKDPNTVAEEVAGSVAKPTYPVIVQADNDWTRAAIAAQATAAMDSATRTIRQPLSSLKAVLFFMFVVIALIEIALVGYLAYDDIKINPNVKIN